MSKDVEKKSKTKFMLKLMVFAAITGAVWNIALRIISGNDNTWEN